MNHIEFALKNGTLVLNGKTLPILSIEQALEFDGKLICLSKFVPPENRTVFALNSQGDLLWRIALDETGKPSTYTNISIENGELVAFAAIGASYTVNPESGAVTFREFLK